MAPASVDRLSLGGAMLLALATLLGCTRAGELRPRPVVPLSSPSKADAGRADTETEEARWLEEAAKRQRGESADMDLDGVPDVFSEPLPGGGRREWADRDADGRREWVKETDGAGNEREEFDSNEDGILEEVRVRTRGPPEQLVLTKDTNWDGRMDRRSTVTFSPTSKRVVEEVDPDGDGLFVVESDDILPPYMAQQAVPPGQPRPDGGR